MVSGTKLVEERLSVGTGDPPHASVFHNRENLAHVAVSTKGTSVPFPKQDYSGLASPEIQDWRMKWGYDESESGGCIARVESGQDWDAKVEEDFNVQFPAYLQGRAHLTFPEIQNEPSLKGGICEIITKTRLRGCYLSGSILFFNGAVRFISHAIPNEPFVDSEIYEFPNSSIAITKPSLVGFPKEIGDLADYFFSLVGTYLKKNEPEIEFSQTEWSIFEDPEENKRQLILYLTIKGNMEEALTLWDRICDYIEEMQKTLLPSQSDLINEYLAIEVRTAPMN